MDIYYYHVSISLIMRQAKKTAGCILNLGRNHPTPQGTGRKHLRGFGPVYEAKTTKRINSPPRFWGRGQGWWVLANCQTFCMSIIISSRDFLRFAFWSKIGIIEVETETSQDTSRLLNSCLLLWRMPPPGYSLPHCPPAEACHLNGFFGRQSRPKNPFLIFWLEILSKLTMDNRRDLLQSSEKMKRSA